MQPNQNFEIYQQKKNKDERKKQSKKKEIKGMFKTN